MRRSAVEDREVGGDANVHSPADVPEETPAPAVGETASTPPPTEAPGDGGTSPAIEGPPASTAAADAPPPRPADAARAETQDPATAILPAATEPAEAPAHSAYDPAAVPRKPGFRERGRMRRRLRYLREVRELGFRDLGGLVFDQHRFQRPNEALVEGKVAAIDAVDRETRALGAALGARSDYSELQIAGVSACQRCGTLHGSEARFCPHCGLAFSGPRFLAGVGAGDDAHSGEPTTTPGQAALFDPAARAAQNVAPPDEQANPQAHDAAS